MMNKRLQKEARNLWSVSDLAGFELQERRRGVYHELENAGRVVHAMPLLALEVEGLPMGYRQFGSMVSSCVAVATDPTSSCAVDFDELSLKVVSERLQDLHKQCLERICSGTCKLVLLEFCCDAGSSLGACVLLGACIISAVIHHGVVMFVLDFLWVRFATRIVNSGSQEVV